MVVCKLESAIWRDPLGDRSMASRQGKESKIPSNSRGFRSSLVDPHSAAPSVAIPFAAITDPFGTGGRVSGCFVEFSVVMTRVRTRWCGRMDSCKLGLPVKTFDHFLHCW